MFYVYVIQGEVTSQPYHAVNTEHSYYH